MLSVAARWSRSRFQLASRISIHAPLPVPFLFSVVPYTTSTRGILFLRILTLIAMAVIRKIAAVASAVSCLVSPAAASFPSYAASLGNMSVPANSSSFDACDFVPGAPVKTTSGTVRGRRANNATTVSEYLGIPFAQPPVGDLRFAPPVKYTSNRRIDGTKFVSRLVSVDRPTS